MSSRSYFTWRYTYPGYAFILIIILKYISIFYQESAFSNSTYLPVVFGFISVLSGAPIGFIISQFWYLIEEHRRKKNVFCIYEKIKPLKADKKPCFCVKDYSEMIILIDYLFSKINNDNLKLYVNRRWDLYNILGSTRIGILLGYAIFVPILICRIIERCTCIIPINFWMIDKRVIGIALVVELVIVFVVAHILYIGLKKNETQHDKMVIVAINEVIKTQKILLKDFNN